MSIKQKRFLFSAAFLFLCLFLLRPFMVNQIILRADGYLGSDIYQEAIRQYKKAALLEPENIEIRNWLAYTYRLSGDTQKSVQAYKQALEIDAQDIFANHNLGMIYALGKDFRSAKSYFLRASSIPPEQKRDAQADYDDYFRMSLLMLSFCQERLGEIQEAIKTNRKILLYYPENEIAKKRLEKLERLNKGQ